MKPEDMTFEHMLASVHGGGYSIANLVIAHRQCNEAAGHLHVMQKIQIRERALVARLKGK